MKIKISPSISMDLVRFTDYFPRKLLFVIHYESELHNRHARTRLDPLRGAFLCALRKIEPRDVFGVKLGGNLTVVLKVRVLGYGSSFNI